MHYLFHLHVSFRLFVFQAVAPNASSNEPLSSLGNTIPVGDGSGESNSEYINIIVMPAWELLLCSSRMHE